MKKDFAVNRRGNVILVEIITFLLIVLWVYASFSQFFQLFDFKIRLEQFPFIGAFAKILFWLIPSLELAIALIFFFPSIRKIAMYLSAVLLILFSAYILALLFIADSIPCSCSGVIPSLSWKQHLFFNIGCLSMSLIGIVLPSKRKKKYSKY